MDLKGDVGESRNEAAELVGAAAGLVERDVDGVAHLVSYGFAFDRVESLSGAVESGLRLGTASRRVLLRVASRRDY